jgi:hypothetical protein
VTGWNRSRCRKRTGRARNTSVRRTVKNSSCNFGKDRNLKSVTGWNRSRCRKRTGRAWKKSVGRMGKRSSPKFGKDRNVWRKRSSSMRDRSTNRSGKKNTP